METNFLHRAWRDVVVLFACLVLIPAGLARAQGAGDAARFGETPYFLVLLVQATGLDYRNHASLLRSLHKSQRKGGFIGHSWVLLSGIEDGRRRVVEAGLSPKDADSMQFLGAVLDLAEYGYVNPTEAQKNNPRYEPDPISFLWKDHGNGHLQLAIDSWVRPTSAIKVDLTVDQYRRITARLDPKLPSHKRFQLTGQQCSSFLAEIAALAGVNLKHQVTIPIPKEVQFNGRRVRLWSDPRYSSLTLSSPDVIEADFKRLVASGVAVDALTWYFAGARDSEASPRADAPRQPAFVTPAIASMQ